MLTLNLEDNLSKSNLDKTNKKKKQKLVKHKRKNWSKTDIKDVEEGIHELKQQQRTGGILAEKKDEDLFYINKDKLVNETETSEVVEPIRKKKRVSLEDKLKNLACYRSLEPDSNSAPAHIVNIKQKPDINSKRQQKLREKNQKVSLSKKKIQKLLSEPNDKENQKLVIKKKGKKIIKIATEKKSNVLIDANFDKDIWNKSDEPVINEINEYYLKSTKKLLPKRPKNPLQKASAVPKLEVPHRGASYNPDYDDHQELLLQAHLKELEKLQKEQKEMRKLSNNVKKMSWDEIEKLWLDEMSVGNLFGGEKLDDEEQDQDDQAEANKDTSASKKLNSKESKAKRKRKQLLEKLKKDKKENEKKQRIQQNEIYRLKTIRKEISEEEKKKEENKLKKEIQEKHKELFMTKRLGSLKYEEPDVEVKLSDEITGNLRTLKPEGNILTDRYKSLQKRNIIEPRERAKRYRKFWKKKFQKKNAYEKTHFIN